MPATDNAPYSSTAFENTRVFTQAILDTALKLGLRPEAIFGALVEE